MDWKAQWITSDYHESKPLPVFKKKFSIENPLESVRLYISAPGFSETFINGFKIGDNVKVSNFMVGQFVDVTSNSIGKGFAGGMKRHNFAGNRATHGVSISHRSHGSTGQCQDPGKVFKGKKMAGHMGNKMRTKQNIEIIKTDLENDIMYLKGSIPGSKNTEVLVKQSVKNIRKLTMSEKIEKMEKLKKVPEKKKK